MYECIKSFSIEKYGDNYLTINEGSVWKVSDDINLEIIKLEHDDGIEVTISKEVLNSCFKEFKDSIITKVIFNNEEPTKYDYKHFDVIFEDGKLRTFHHHKSNPIPKEIEILGLTWEELHQLCIKKWNEVVNDTSFVNSFNS